MTISRVWEEFQETARYAVQKLADEFPDTPQHTLGTTMLVEKYCSTKAPADQEQLKMRGALLQGILEQVRFTRTLLKMNQFHA
jgi:wobble nucleotide-excising tRNase